MLQHDDESLDQDPLLEFSNESPADDADPSSPLQAVAPATFARTTPKLVATTSSTEGLTTRVERLERNLTGAMSEIASLKLELVTLVGTIGDMKKREVRGNARLPKPPVASSVPLPPPYVLAIVVAIATAIMGWAIWPIVP